MRRLVPALAIGCGLVAAGPLPAAKAQFLGWDWGGSWGGLSPRDISQSILQRGFRMIAPLQRDGAVFVADVVDRRGRRERLIVAAVDGQILQRFLLDDPRLPGYGPGQRGREEFGDPDAPTQRAERDPRPVPPGLIPGAGTNAGQDADPNAADGAPDVEPVMPRRIPKVIRTPHPRIVERTPDGSVPPHAVPAAPAPVAPGEPLPIAPHPRITDPLRIPGESTTTASRPVEPPPHPKVAPETAAPAAPPPPDTGTSAKLTDPLRIPGPPAPPPAKEPAEAPHRPTTTAAGSVPAGVPPLGTKAAPRVIPGSITGAPAVPPKPAPAAKPGDVPVAPLD